MGGEGMRNGKNGWIIKGLALLLFLLVCAGCGLSGGGGENFPYEPDTPAPAPHDGVFVSEHGTMRFGGDGERVTVDFDEELAAWCGLPEGEQEGTYVFLSGDLPPHGSMPVRYDVAHELELTVGGQRAVIQLGIAAEDGRTATSGLDMVTPERIPLLFSGEHFFSVVFQKEE